MLERRTKIVATLGPATDADGVLDRLVRSGLDCARLNCSHGGHDDLRRRAAEVRAASARAGRAIGLLFDLQGPKLRLSAATEPRAVMVGEEVVFGPGGVVVDFDKFPALVTERSQIVIGDGVPRFAVSRVDGADVVTTCVSPGPLAPRKGIYVTYARPELPAITEKVVADLGLAAEMGADFIALSFVRSAADMEQLRELALEVGSAAKLIAKIEKIEAYEALDEIIAASDGLMVARGDYGVEAGVARVPLMQKDTIRRATQSGKFVITATQMLESMIQAPEPTRAEATDVANAVIDGTSAVMLSAETSVGSYPLETVRAMAEIAAAAEEYPVIHGRAVPVVTGVTGEAVMRAAVELADELDAAALIV
ncbi:MAG: pyruvate kinase, partial [Solirubrobacteraceae bacterium]|nr:pyruvate kinase [Solirubrobacteraceae bacterium]